jgi:hypothetical protein
VAAIAAVAVATGQLDDWGGNNPDYVGHLLAHGRVVVAEDAGMDPPRAVPSPAQA